MDALQISGKWYISARRAAKENGYHSDYIGQLVRSGKVKGTKVGRAWYVLADSFTDYLSIADVQEKKEAQMPYRKEEKEARVETPEPPTNDYVEVAPKTTLASAVLPKPMHEVLPQSPIEKIVLPPHEAKKEVRISTPLPRRAAEAVSIPEVVKDLPKREHQLMTYLKEEEDESDSKPTISEEVKSTPVISNPSSASRDIHIPIRIEENKVVAEISPATPPVRKAPEIRVSKSQAVEVLPTLTPIYKKKGRKALSVIILILLGILVLGGTVAVSLYHPYLLTYSS
ncbi:MAG: hypothetical protein KGJ34_02075 [Patescibacteria group bacterium]|nr:hypothetical protein [Patescibacteria group bacterium]